MERTVFDFSKLLGRLKTYGYRQEDIAPLIPLSQGTLSAKLNNKGIFTVSEIDRLCMLLDIPKNEIGDYFFTHKV